VEEKETDDTLTDDAVLTPVRLKLDDFISVQAKIDALQAKLDALEVEINPLQEQEERGVTLKAHEAKKLNRLREKEKSLDEERKSLHEDKKKKEERLHEEKMLLLKGK
jgi:chromosome segregation ATPase